MGKTNSLGFNYIKGSRGGNKMASVVINVVVVGAFLAVLAGKWVYFSKHASK